MTSMVEKVATAINDVQLFIRFNDWASDRVEGSPIEICRYGNDGEPEIVVVKRFSGAKKEDDALYEVISEQRSIAAIKAMVEPTDLMVGEGIIAYDGRCETSYRAMIDAALKETDNAHDR